MKQVSKAIEILQQDYAQRKQRNSRFSKRSYAKLLGLSSGRLVDLLNERTPLSEKTALAVLNKLLLSPEEQNHFLNLVHLEQMKRVDRRKMPSPPSLIIQEDTKSCLLSALSSHNSLNPITTDFSSVVISLAPDRLPEAKRIIRDFQYKLARLAKDQSEMETYLLNIQLFPHEG